MSEMHSKLADLHPSGVLDPHESSELATALATALARSIVQSAVDGIITIDEEGSIESINPAAERIFGFDQPEIVGCNINVLMPEPYHSRHDHFINDYLSTGRKKIIGIGREVEGRRRDGTTFPMHLAVSELSVGGRRMFAGIVRVITGYRKAEEAVRESERKLSTLISNLPGVAYRIRNDEHSTLEFVSEGCLPIVGYTSSELLAGTRTIDLVHPDDRPLVREQTEAGLSQRRQIEIVYRLRHRSGEYRWVWDRNRGVYSDDGEVLGIEGFLTDITE